MFEFAKYVVSRVVVILIVATAINAVADIANKLKKEETE